jgi:hypothetical protein
MPTKYYLRKLKLSSGYSSFSHFRSNSNPVLVQNFSTLLRSACFQNKSRLEMSVRLKCREHVYRVFVANTGAGSYAASRWLEPSLQACP